MSDLISQTIFDFISESPTPVTKRQVARAFNIKGGENRVALKQILKKLEKDGRITKQAGGVYSSVEGMPPVAVLTVHEIGADGDVFAKPLEWTEDQGTPPRIEIVPDKKNYCNVREGSRALCRLSKTDPDAYEARIIRLIDEGAKDNGGGDVLGIIALKKNNAVLQPTNKRAKHDFDLNTGDLNGAKDGDLVAAEILPSRGLKRKRVRVTQVIGRQGDPKTISLISLHEAGLSDHFPKAVNEATKGMKVPPLGSREDLRDVPLVTIDGADARDFDDAVYAKPREDGGFDLIVAIADVAYYVRAGDTLDVEAQKRGNSTYFPDRVVPMLPEALSNDLCSLRPNEVRASLAVHMRIDEAGKLIKHRFTRALIKSHARLTYEQVQAAKDGNGDKTTAHLMGDVIEPLYAAYKILEKARRKRGALDLDLPERQILICDDRRQNPHSPGCA